MLGVVFLEAFGYRPNRRLLVKKRCSFFCCCKFWYSILLFSLSWFEPDVFCRQTLLCHLYVLEQPNFSIFRFWVLGSGGYC